MAKVDSLRVIYLVRRSHFPCSLTSVRPSVRPSVLLSNDLRRRLRRCCQPQIDARAPLRPPLPPAFPFLLPPLPSLSLPRPSVCPPASVVLSSVCSIVANCIIVSVLHALLTLDVFSPTTVLPVPRLLRESRLPLTGGVTE